MSHQSRPKPAASSRQDNIDILDLYRPDISRLLADLGSPAFRRAQVLEHLLQRPGQTFAEATNLPLDVRTSLDAMGASTLTVATTTSSEDGATKLLLRAPDGAAIETVVMRYRDRVTACISSHVGCAVGCAFCATGTLGLTRNLSAAEIVDQVRAASALLAGEGRRLSNLVYMGMGEPLLNLQAVLNSIRIITDSRGMNMAHRSLSISTVGVPAGIRRLAREEPQVNLAISLHAADDRTRARLIPATFRQPIATILEAAWDHFEITRRKLLIEYVLIGGVNDSMEDARHLATLLRGHVVTVNLLAWNPVPALAERPVGAAHERPGRRTAGRDSGRAAASQQPGRSQACDLAGFAPPTPQAIAAFRGTLLALKIEAVVRQSKGTAIQAACGQLAAQSRNLKGGGR